MSRRGKTKTAGPTSCRLSQISKPVGIFPLLLLVDCFLQFGPWCKLCNFAGSDFDSGACLRIAPVPRFSLRYRECAETYQSHPISLPEGRRDAVHSGVDRSSGLRFAHFTSACDLVNEIGFVHSLSSQVSFDIQRGVGGISGAAGKPVATYFPPSVADVNCENPHGKPVLHGGGSGLPSEGCF